MKESSISGALLDSIEPIKTSSVNEIAQNRLLELIAAGQLRPGDKLPSQRLLAERLGISQVPIREALRSLEALGLVEARVGSGWYVKEYSFDHIAKALAPRLNLSETSLQDLDDIRTHLECAYLPEAVRTLTPEKLVEAEKALGEMERLQDNPAKISEFSRHDRRFHVSLFSGVSNRIFLELLEMFWVLHSYLQTWIQSQDREPAPDGEQRRKMRIVAQKHREFFTAITNGDVDLAVELRRKRLGPLAEQQEDAEATEK